MARRIEAVEPAQHALLLRRVQLHPAPAQARGDALELAREARAVTGRAGDGGAIEGPLAEHARRGGEARAGEREVHQQLAIPAHAVGDVEARGALESAAPEEGRLLPHHADAGDVAANVERVRRSLAQERAAALVDQPDGAA